MLLTATGATGSAGAGGTGQTGGGNYHYWLSIQMQLVNI